MRGGQKRASLLIITLVLMSTFYLGVTILPENVKATVLYVGGTGPGNYTTIRAAIISAREGDTIFVYEGTYHENFGIGYSMSLVGEDRETTRIVGDNTMDGVRVIADWVNITGFNITGHGNDRDEAGIHLDNSENSRIFGNTICSNNEVGIRLFHSHNNLIEGNAFYRNSELAVELWYSDDNTLVNNTVYSSGVGGFDIDKSNRNTVFNNTFMRTGNGILVGTGNNNTIVNNTVSNSGRGILLGGSVENLVANNTLSNNGLGIHFQGGSNLNIIASNTVTSNDYGMAFQYSNLLTVINNSIEDSFFSGIQLHFSWANTIIENTISSSQRFGFYVDDSSHNNISNNVLSSNGLGGFGLFTSSTNTISDNTLMNNWDGFYLFNSSSNMFSGNAILSNQEGMDITNSSNDNTIVDNIVVDNREGIIVFESSGNTVYHNSFIDNTGQAYDNSVNSWDNGYPSGGNFWSDYVGVDEKSGPNQDLPGSDWIGDSPHDIPGGLRRDRYPLITPDGSHKSIPLSPQNLDATPGNGNVTLAWSPPTFDGLSPITNYRIYRGTIPGGETFLSEIGNVLSYRDIGLTNGQMYYYEVSAVNGEGEGPRSNEVSATPATIPGTPVGLIAVAGSEQVALTWSPPIDHGGSAITNYRIYRGSVSGGETFHVEIGNVPIYVDMGLTNGQTYYYKVSAVNIVGEGPRSDEASATPLPHRDLPTAPRNLQAFPGNQQVTLIWEPPAFEGASAVTNYRVYRGTTSGGEILLLELGNVLTHVDTGLTNGQTYYYEISAVNGLGEGSRSNEASAIPTSAQTVPLAPRNLQAFPEDQQVILGWDAPPFDGNSAIANYSVYRGATPGSVTFLAEIGNVLTYLDAGLTNGQAYYYQVSAVNSVGEGPKSNKANATPSAGPIILQITEIQDSASVGDMRIEVFNEGFRAIPTSEIYLSPDGLIPWIGGTWSGTFASPSAHSVYSLGPGEAFASTEGGTIGLYDSNDSLFDSVSFGQAGPVPDPLNDESVARYWAGSNYSDVWIRDPTPTFGTQNDIYGRLDPPPIVLNEVFFNAIFPSERFVEIHYPGTSSVNISGWTLVVDSQYVLPPVSLDATASHFVLRGGDFPVGFDMDDGWSNGDNAYLYDPLGRLVDMVGWSAPHTRGQSVARVNDQTQWGFDGFDDNSSTAAGWVFGGSPTPEIVSLEPDQSKSVEIGETVEHHITLDYSGSSDDVFDIDFFTSMGWPVSATDMFGNPIVDNDGDARPDTGVVVAGDSLDLNVLVTAPNGSKVGDVETVRVTATSSVNPNVFDMVTLETTAAHLPYITLNKSANPKTIWLEGLPFQPQETTITLNVTGAGSPIAWNLPQDTVFVIDVSGSMNQNDPQDLRLSGVKAYVDMLKVPDRVAIVIFDEVANFVNNHHLTSDYDQVKADIDSIPPPNGNTNSAAGLKLANDELRFLGREDHTWIEILLTDGHNSGTLNDTLSILEAQSAAALGIVIFTIGLSNDSNAALLQQIAAITGGEFFLAPTAEAIENIYLTIHQIQKVSNIAGRKVGGTVVPNPMVRDVLHPYIHYVPGSFRDQYSNPSPPDVVTVNPDGSTTLDWNVSKILINESWIVKYEVTSSQDGYVPVGVHPLSRVNYTKVDESIETLEFPEVFVRVLAPEPTGPPVLSIVSDQIDVRLSWTIPGPNVSHYLIYRAPDQREFDFSKPYKDTSKDSDGGVIWTRTSWNDTGAALDSKEYYYVVRAVNIFGAKSITSNTVGVWTEDFSAGLDTLSLPLEHMEAHNVSWYADNIPNVECIRWMDSTGHWVTHYEGMQEGEDDIPIEMGRGYEILLTSETRYTFTGYPASSIRYREGLGDSVGFGKSLVVQRNGMDVMLSWDSASGASEYKIFRSNERDGLHDLSLQEIATVPSTQNTWTDIGILSNEGEYYYMVIPASPDGTLGSSTYSVGVITIEYQSGSDTFALPLKTEEIRSLDWHCDEIPNVVGMAYMISEVWKFHAIQMPEGVYDVEVLQGEGYQISFDGSSTGFTFIGY